MPQEQDYISTIEGKITAYIEGDKRALLTLKYAVGKTMDKMLADGVYTKEGKCGAAVGTALEPKFGLIYCEAWFTGCLNMYRRLSKTDVDLLISKAASPSYVSTMLVKKSEETRKDIMAAIRSGKNTGFTKAPKVRKSRKRISDGAQAHRASESGLVHFCIKGDESEDDIESIITSVLSAARRLGHAYSKVVDRALKRVQNMDA